MKHVIGIDGGGTKTVAVLSDEKGNILRRETGEPTSWRNAGIELSAERIFSLIKKIAEGKEISSICVALAAVEEEYKDKKEEYINKLKNKGIVANVFVVSDQLAAFRAGTEKKEGIILVAGTGTAARGWKGEKEEKASAWGYLADEGSAFYVGIEGFRRIQKSFDGRAFKTEMEALVREKWRVQSGEELNIKIYNNFMEAIPALSVLVSEAGDKGDKAAQKILQEAAQELALSVKTVMQKLKFQKTVPLVLTGGMFNCATLFAAFMEEVKKFYPRLEILFVENPAEGAVKLALERKNNGNSSCAECILE